MTAGQKYPLVPGLTDESADLSATSSAPDEESKVSANDTTSGKLADKIVAGTGINVNEVNDGGDEDLEIVSTVVNVDEKAKVTMNDTTPGFLQSKIVGGTGININVLNPSGDEDLEIVATGPTTDELVKASSNDTTAAYLDTKLTAGTNVTLVELNDGGNESIQINSSGGGGSITVTDGTTTVNPTTTIDFTSGATVTDAGGGTAEVAISGGGGGGSSLEFEYDVNLKNANQVEGPATNDNFASGTVPGITGASTLHFRGTGGAYNFPNYDTVVQSDLYGYFGIQGGSSGTYTFTREDIESSGVTEYRCEMYLANRSGGFEATGTFNIYANSTLLFTVDETTIGNSAWEYQQTSFVAFTAADTTTITFERVAGSNADETLAIAGFKLWAKAAGGGGGGAGTNEIVAYEELGRVDFSNTSSVTFSSIDQTYDALEIKFVGTSDQASNNIAVSIALNSDTTDANYHMRDIALDETGPTVGGFNDDGGAAARFLGNIPGTTATNIRGKFDINIEDYSNTSYYKTLLSELMQDGITTGLRYRQIEWEDTSAITQIDITPASGTFATGYAILLGRKKLTVGGAATDELAKVSSNDTTADYLASKIVAGTGITINELNDGSNETLEIVSTGGGGGGGAGTTEIVGHEEIGRIDFSNTSSVVFASIPQDYDALEIKFVGRSDQAALNVGVKIVINDDTTDANYIQRDLILETGVPEAQGNIEDGTVGARYIFNIPGTTVADKQGFGRVVIEDYSSTSYYKSFSSTIMQDGISSGNRWRGNEWESTAAVTKIELVLDAGTLTSGYAILLGRKKLTLTGSTGNSESIIAEQMIHSVDLSTLTPATSYVTPALDQTYDYLKIRCKNIKFDGATVFSGFIRFNGDNTVANYQRVIHGTSDMVLAQVNSGTSSPFFLGQRGDEAATLSTFNEIEIYDYNDASRSTAFNSSANSRRAGTAQDRLWYTSGMYTPTGAITSITFLSTGADNLVSGTIEVIGVKEIEVGTDDSVKVSSNDNASDFLANKLVAGSGITLSELNDGGTETLEIASSTAGGGPATAKIYGEEEVGFYSVVSNVGSITFDNISQDYDSLILEYTLVSDYVDAGAFKLDRVNVEFNSDGNAANYLFFIEGGAGVSSTTSSVLFFSSTQTFGYCSASNSTDWKKQTRSELTNYTATDTHKAIEGKVYHGDVDTNQVIYSHVGNKYLSTAAITKIRLTPDSGSNFTDGYVRLLGRKKITVEGASNPGVTVYTKTLLSEQDLSTLTGQTDLTFSSIDQTYDTLLIECTDIRKAAFFNPAIFVNGDTTTTNYYTNYFLGDGTGSPADSFGNFAGFIYGLGSGETGYTESTITFRGYADTSSNPGYSFDNRQIETTNSSDRITYGSTVLNTGAAAITSITLSSATNFVSGFIRLFGLKEQVIGGGTTGGTETIYATYEIARETLTGSSNTVSFDNIDQTYDQIEVEFINFSTSEANTNSNISYALNDDTTNGNYTRDVVFLNGSTPTGSIGSNSRVVLGVPGSSSPNQAGGGTLQFVNYNATTKYKLTRTTYSLESHTASLFSQHSEWANTSAITKITFSSVGNFTGIIILKGKKEATVGGSGGDSSSVSTVQETTASLNNGETEAVSFTFATRASLIGTISTNVNAQLKLYAKYDATIGLLDDPFWNAVVVHADFEGTNGQTTFTEESFFGATATFNSGAQLSTAQKNLNDTTSLAIGDSASSDFVSFPTQTYYNADFDTPFTIECFARFTSAGDRAMASMYDLTATQAGWLFRQVTGGNINFVISQDASGATTDSFSTSATVSTGQWYHLAVTYDGAKTFTIYIDGTGEKFTRTITAFHQSTSILRIGAYLQTASAVVDELDGNLEGFRFTNGVNRYPYDFTIPTAAYPTALETSFDPNFDIVALHADGEGTNGQTSFTEESYHQRSLTFSGSSQLSNTQVNLNSTTSFNITAAADYISIGAVDDFIGLYDGTVDKWTLEFWLYYTQNASLTYLLAQAISSTTSGISVFVGNGAGNITFDIYRQVGGQLLTRIQVTAPSAGAWHHIAWTKDGDDFEVFFDGVSAGTDTRTLSYSTTSAPYPLEIGTQDGGVNSEVLFMEGLRITYGKNIYPRDFAIPTTTFPNVLTYDKYFDAVVLLADGEGTDGQTTFTDQSNVGASATFVNNAELSNAQTNLNPTTSFAFDGTDDVVEFPNTTLFDMNVNRPFTIECYVYPTNDSTTIISKWNDFADTDVFLIQRESGKLKLSISQTGDGVTRDDFSTTANLSASVWSHIAVIYDGIDTFTLSINGVGEQFTRTITSINTSAEVIRLGAHIGSANTIVADLNGNIEGVRFTNNVNRYPADFPAPTVAHPLQGIPEFGTPDHHLLETVNTTGGTLSKENFHIFNIDESTENTTIEVTNNSGGTSTVDTTIKYIAL